MTNDHIGILVVDDEFSVRDSLCNWLRKGGHRVESAENADEALLRFQDRTWDLVLLDIKMPGMDGLELQRRIRELNPGVVVIIITAYASAETAVQALKEGAFDYITKPIDPDQLDHLVRNAVEQLRLRTENMRLREKIGLTRTGEILGESPPMREVRELVNSAAQTDAAVLIHGGRGTGKEHIARTIHARSRRRVFPFVPVSCAGIAEELLESELFGHEKGALRGAQYDRKGRIELAHGGTLFFDEIGAIGSDMQVKLLQVLNSSEFTRVGGRKPVSADFRTIGASCEDPVKLMQEGRIREDLFYRVNVITIEVPSLRERRADIPLLARHFLRKYALETDKNVGDIDSAAMDALVRYEWPGNVRELANGIEHAVAVARDAVIRPADLPVQVTSVPEKLGQESLAEIERTHIVRILERTSWDTSRAADILQIDRAALADKIAKYGLRR
jgi:DNA-binding NtrC family response regulator